MRQCITTTPSNPRYDERQISKATHTRIEQTRAQGHDLAELDLHRVKSLNRASCNMTHPNRRPVCHLRKANSFPDRNND